MKEEVRKQAEQYAIACGWSEEVASEATDEQLQRLMNQFADDCDRWGCD